MVQYARGMRAYYGYWRTTYASLPADRGREQEPGARTMIYRATYNAWLWSGNREARFGPRFILAALKVSDFGRA